jgi:hypothetical protein
MANALQEVAVIAVFLRHEYRHYQDGLLHPHGLQLFKMLPLRIWVLKD